MGDVKQPDSALPQSRQSAERFAGSSAAAGDLHADQSIPCCRIRAPAAAMSGRRSSNSTASWRTSPHHWSTSPRRDGEFSWRMAGQHGDGVLELLALHADAGKLAQLIAYCACAVTRSALELRRR